MAARYTTAAATLSLKKETLIPTFSTFSANCVCSFCFNRCFCESEGRRRIFYCKNSMLAMNIGCGLKINTSLASELTALAQHLTPTSPGKSSSEALTGHQGPPAPWRRHKRCYRKQKRGKRGGIQVRLTAKPHRPSIPTIVLANVRSLDNKLDYIRLLRSSRKMVQDSCVFIFTETWLNNNIPDSGIQLEGLSCYRADREISEGGKSRGGGLCIYTNDAWCRDVAVVCKHCSPLVEFMIIKCRPFYLPREFTAVLLVAVYIPPTSNIKNRKEALYELFQSVSDQQTAHPDAFLVLAGDFNHADPKSVFPKVYQHIDFPTRGNNILDLVYTTKKGAYKALPLPHLGASDHITVLLLPAYRPLVKVTKPVRKQIRVWSDDSLEKLKDCFRTTDWDMFKQASTHNNITDLQEYTETVIAYIIKCIEDVTVSKTIIIRPNQKPWITSEVLKLVRVRDAAFKSGDKEKLRTARANLSCGIKKAKEQYSKKITDHFSDSRDTRSLWVGTKTITDYRAPPQTCASDTALLNALNEFFARFEAHNRTPAQKSTPPPEDRVLKLSPESVRRCLRRINARKAPGPDNIPGRVLKGCADELTDVLTDIFNTSLQQAVVPTCLKATTIIPVPKKSPPSCFNDYRPVALTPVLMKCFERLVMDHIKSVLPPTLDPYQFAYRSNRSTEDAISTALHTALTHLETKDSYVRMLFLDFSSAFNTIIPQQLIHKLLHLGINTSLCNWLLDFLTGRPQAVRVGGKSSRTITLNTGAPQGCVLSPLLFTLLTHDCTPLYDSNLFIKFADDTTVVGLISNRDESNYRSEVNSLAMWCTQNNLSLNVEKTKEIVVDFRRAQVQHAPLTINGAAVERVSSTKFLGVHITEKLSWNMHTTSLVKKSHQRLYFLRKLRRARVPAFVMSNFYRGTIESILTSSITVWHGASTASCRRSLQRIVGAAEKICGVPLPTINDMYATRLTRKAIKIGRDPSHPSHSLFRVLPSGKRLRSLRVRSSRLRNSFIPEAIRKLNSLPSLPPLLPLPPAPQS